MADTEHLKILKEGVQTWNKWRADNPDMKPMLAWADLNGADLHRAHLNMAYLNEAHLHGVDLNEAHLHGAHLNGANLSRAYLNGANLSGANLSRARLNGAYLKKAHLSGAYLKEAHLNEAYLNGADLSGARLNGADLSGADLNGAHLSGADLSGAHLNGAHLISTGFGNTTLSNTIGLDACDHRGPSHMDQRTLATSPNLPPIFLKGCGLTDWEIESVKLHNPKLRPAEVADIATQIHLLRAESPIQVHNLFISYSHANSAFVERLEAVFDEKRIRYWRDVHDLPAGPVDTNLEIAIRNNPTVLLVLSENSVNSDWVEFEAQTARDLEKELDRHVLCPVALDDAWKTCKWSGPLRQQMQKYNIMDFSKWEDKTQFDQKFRLLFQGLNLHYREAED